MKKEEIIFILDFGSQYTHLIKSSLNKLGTKSVIEPADFSLNRINRKYKNFIIKGLILSGGAYSVTQEKIPFDKNWLSFNIPVLGICYGHQLIAHILGGNVKATGGEYGNETVVCDIKNQLFSNIKPQSTVWMSHNDVVTNLPKGFVSIASSKNYKNTGFYSKEKSIYGLQFHPEVSHTTEGIKILRNFAFTICKIRKSETWSPKTFVKQSADIYKTKVNNKTVILGLSGGVDSSTLAVFLRSFLRKNQLNIVYIDSGFEQSHTAKEVKMLCKKFNINLIIKDSSDIFFKKLKGITDPDEKRIVIGNVFIKEFEKVASEKNADIFAQGTIWSDVIESGVSKYSSTIKPHHNVGGIPKKINFELIEPFRELFKDQVRSLAAYLKLPVSFIERPVFPGPGFAIRVEGEVTKGKIAVVRKSTEIIQEVLTTHGLNKGFMGFAVYINAKSTGVKGDMRFTNDYAIVIRIVETLNLLTANFSKKVFPYLEEISGRIIKETGTGKVLYDITNKPPSTIDWQ